jgi:hypothetical protein
MILYYTHIYGEKGRERERREKERRKREERGSWLR